MGLFNKPMLQMTFLDYLTMVFLFILVVTIIYVIWQIIKMFQFNNQKEWDKQEQKEDKEVNCVWDHLDACKEGGNCKNIKCVCCLDSNSPIGQEIIKYHNNKFDIAYQEIKREIETDFEMWKEGNKK